ncbi:sensor histidine kinase KdpD [Planosporangium flavigriseum]|uniref:histidine kinase n=1 Tax=Planosporangium flavigriseum TaxID=373681 RepID=A0A8J3LE64_9ACTN|nr:ATP-binding protein [Planosporangium flavigriseum]NJC65165.1 sensor histidine kinase KdpD [Planosporangium flavigriseum]GIG71783.1 sensor histidine kinase [Planosporangium flavigriseum]
MARGQLRVYLGAAPGVGKTYKMLEEGRRRHDRGTDVVIGFVETYGRRVVETLLRNGLEVVPRKEMAYRGATFTEMDLDAVLARSPQVALIDELAHTNVPGSGNAKRWQDIEQLLEAGITVVTTLNIQHLDSLNDVIQEITGVVQRETVPDEVVRRAEQIELVDMTPEALRRRMVHGNIYQPDKIDAALGNYFRVGNLTALRELALLWLANKVDDQLDRYRAGHHIDQTWETCERVVVALTGGSEGDTVVRRAGRIAARTKGAELRAVHVARSDGLAGADPAHLARQRVLVESLGGTYHQVVGSDVPAALLEFARGVNATQLVLGTSRRGRLAQIFSPGVGVTTAAESGHIDVHLVSHEEAKRGRQPVRITAGLTRGRQLAGLALAVVGLPLLTLLLDRVRADLSMAGEILSYLLAVLAVGLVGGILPSLFAAALGALLVDWYFIPPLHQLAIARLGDRLGLFIFLLAAVAVSTVVQLAARRTGEAAHARAQAETLTTVAGSVLRGERPLPALLEQVGETFSLASVTLLELTPDAPHGPEQRHDPAAWRIAAYVGGPPAATPSEGDTDVPIIGGLSLVLRGRPLDAADRRVVEAFAAQAALALRQERLAEQAGAATVLSEVDRMRSALLGAVSRDLRTPLSAVKDAVASLRSHEVAADDEDRAVLLTTADVSIDRLGRMVENLLDMSRLQAGALAMRLQLVSVDETLPRAVQALGEAGRSVGLEVPDDVPELYADPALLERVLVNLIANAVRFSPAGRPPTVSVSEHGGQVEVRVIDHGPGILIADREKVFLPFQQWDGGEHETGAGLGLALSRGFTQAMGGDLTPETTAGGGLTMTLSLPAADLDAVGKPPPDIDVQRADPAILDRIDSWTVRDEGSGP